MISVRDVVPKKVDGVIGITSKLKRLLNIVRSRRYCSGKRKGFE